MKAYILLAIILAAFAVGGASAWKVQDWRHDAAEKQRLEAEGEKRRMDAKQIDSAAVGHEKDKSAIKTEFVTITQEVERVVEKPVYRDECFDADGLRALGNAIGPAAAASQPAGAMRGSSAAH